MCKCDSNCIVVAKETDVTDVVALLSPSVVFAIVKLRRLFSLSTPRIITGHYQESYPDIFKALVH
jgi:hypothetical protein